MPEFRQDPLSRHWVIIAAERANRPNEYAPAKSRRIDNTCAFCQGNEHLTTETLAIFPENAASPASAADSWRVRVIKNKYPALLPNCGAFSPSGDLWVRGAGHGAHEVIVESPRHLASFSELDEAEAFWTFLAYRERLRFFSRQEGIAWAQIFKNVGADGGASVDHSHSQVLALPFAPPGIRQEWDSAQEYWRQNRRCVLCESMEDTSPAQDRIVIRSENFAAFCPFAPRFSYETWIAPLRHWGRFEDAAEADLAELANLVQELIRRFEKLLNKPAYNYLLHSGAFDADSKSYFHWHLEAFPRISKVAGFEFGAGCYVNPVSPEDAALALRDVIL